VPQVVEMEIRKLRLPACRAPVRVDLDSPQPIRTREDPGDARPPLLGKGHQDTARIADQRDGPGATRLRLQERFPGVMEKFWALRGEPPARGLPPGSCQAGRAVSPAACRAKAT